MRALDAGILVCGECHQLNRADGDEHPRCSRCGAVLHARRPNSLTRTWALLITAAILYIPANLLPIMTVNLFGSGMPATIMEGVVELVHADMFPIAMVVFVASILVPTFKLVGIEANLGAAAFASVVVLTMLAAVTFDPRLIWDNTNLDDENE